MTRILTGHSIVAGVAIGRIHLAEQNELEIGEYRINPEDVESEIRRYRKAVEAARRQLEEIAERINESVEIPAVEIIQTHVLMLGDSTLRRSTEEHISRELCNAEWALQLQLERVLLEFRSIEDEYIRTRGEDVIQVVRLIQSKLTDDASEKPFKNIPDRLADTLVIAEELTPGELAILHDRGVAGIVTEHGGPHSHTAILASSLGIPAVLGVRGARTQLTEGELLILDGDKGEVYADPDETTLQHFRQVQRDQETHKKSLQSLRDRSSTSIDGTNVALQANAEHFGELQQAIEFGAKGIGLYRTEFLYLQGTPPDEETQLAEYCSAIEMLGGIPLTIRTLDLGADKSNDSIDFAGLRTAANPALGLRAIRLCLRDTELFKTQLRAILRASAAGPVRCLIPMITNVQEIQRVHELVAEAKNELSARNLPYDRDLQLGGMIEVPAAALAIPQLGPYLDFISVGTNDLLQYALAADRGDEQLAELYDLQHPGVVNLLKYILKQADKLGIPVAVCGEVAGDRRYTRLLLALGLREFSMHPARLLEVKQVIRDTHLGNARQAIKQWLGDPVLQAETSLLEFLERSETASKETASTRS